MKKISLIITILVVTLLFGAKSAQAWSWDFWRSNPEPYNYNYYYNPPLTVYSSYDVGQPYNNYFNQDYYGRNVFYQSFPNSRVDNYYYNNYYGYNQNYMMTGRNYYSGSGGGYYDHNRRY